MKRAYLFLIFVLVMACEKQSFQDLTIENNFSLVSPGGIVIADDVESLKSKIKSNAVAAFGDKEYYITNIEYTETGSQIAAIVEFNSIDKEFGSVLILTGIGKAVKNGRVLNPTNPPIVIDCSGSCDTKGATCRERVIVHPDGTLVYECTCSGECKMTIET